MKKLNTLVSLSLCLSFGLPATVLANVSADQAPKTIQVTKSKSQVIQEQIIALGTKKDSGVRLDIALADLATNFHLNNITKEDVETFVAEKGGTKALKSYKENVELLGGHAAELSPEDQGIIYGEALSSLRSEISPENLSWSGCTGFAIGAIVIVGAIITTVIAASKNKTEEQVRRDYARDRQNREQRYLRDLTDEENRPQNLEKSIVDLDAEMADIDNDIAYLNGQIDILDNGEQRQAKINERNRKMELKDEYQERRAVLTAELANYSDPNYMTQRIVALTDDYQSDINGLYVDEENRIELVPLYQEQAKTMFVVAGVAGALSTYLAIDGGLDCFSGGNGQLQRGAGNYSSY
jgi:cell division protein FtsB